MSRTLLISGPPGCGKTAWILSQLQRQHGAAAICAWLP